MSWTSLTTKQSDAVTSLLTQYDIQPDELIDELIKQLNTSLIFINELFASENLERDRKSIARDNKRIKQIFAIIEEFENDGLKKEFTNSLVLFTQMVDHPYFLPAANELNRHIVKSCITLASVLKGRGHFKKFIVENGSKKGNLYQFIAALVNILRPKSFDGDMLTEGEIKAFKKFLVIGGSKPFPPNPPTKRKLKP